MQEIIPHPRNRSVVSYDTELFKVANRETWALVVSKPKAALWMSCVIFCISAGITWGIRGDAALQTVLVSALIGIVTLILAYFLCFLNHWLYQTPRRFCAEMQQKLNAERAESALAIEKEQGATRAAIAERDELKRLLDEKPLRPIQKRDRYDDFIRSGERILSRLPGKDGGSFFEEAVTWMNELEAFGRRHLSLSENKAIFDASNEGFTDAVMAGGIFPDNSPPALVRMGITLGNRLETIKTLRAEVRD
jgi:hypothetical protein